LEKLWAGLEAQHGAYNQVTETEPTPIDDVDGVSVTIECADGTAQLGIATDDQTIVKFDNLADYSPPSYADQSAFTEHAVEVGPQSLPGTVSVPSGADGVPGVVLVHGSGSVDRDATLGPNKVFKDLAWGLASRGIAVLRYDKRTFTQDVPPADKTLETVTVTDAVAAVNRLADVPAVDPQRRIVVGHSLGAMATPRLLNRTDAIAGVMLAAHARPITDVVVDQVRHGRSVIDGTLTSQDKQEIKQLEQTFQQVKNGDIPDEKDVFDTPAAWWKSLLSYDQVATARELSVPLWIGQGGRDYQVSSEKDFQQWQTALSGESNVTFSLYEQLSHLLSPGRGPSLWAEYEYHDNVLAKLVTDLASWISMVEQQ
jgi:Lysophospholipase